MNKLLTTIVFIWIVSCGCKQPESKVALYKGEQVSFQKTGLKEIIDFLIVTFGRLEHGRNAILIEGRSESFTTDSLIQLLVDMKVQDKTNAQTYDVFKSTCNGIATLSWQPKSKDAYPFRLVKHIYLGTYTEFESNSIDLEITDFEIYTPEGNRTLMLRVAEDYEFEQLTVGDSEFRLNGYEKIINGVVYKPVFESRLLGLDEILKDYELKKKACR